MSTKEQALRELFLEAIDWGRSYGQRLNITDVALNDAAEGFMDKAQAALALPLSAEAVTGPSDAELNKFQERDEFWKFGRLQTNLFARAVLARWGSPPVAAPADGFKLVPVKVTDEMLRAFAGAASSDWDGTTEEQREEVRKGFGPAYEAMLAAAPTPAAATTTGEAAAPGAQSVSDNGADNWKSLDARISDYLWGFADGSNPALEGEVRIPPCPPTIDRGAWIMDRLPQADMMAVRSYYDNSARAMFASQAHGKSEAAAYPAMPKPYTTEYDDIDKEDVPCYALAQVHAAIDADRAQRPAAPADGAALADERAAFEAEYPMPSGLQWDGERYICREGWEDSYRCNSFVARWDAWQARAALASAQGDAAQQPALEADFGSVMKWLNENCVKISWNVDSASFEVSDEQAFALVASFLAAPQPAPAHPDAARLDAMERKRIAVTPEFEGQWGAEVYGDDEKPQAVGIGATPRAAIDTALAASGTSQEGGAK